jgi:uncharacterized protein YggT (Ycf19 family)
MGSILCALVTMAILILMVQAVLSFIPKSYDSPWARLEATLRRMSDPVMAPIRSVMPRPGGIPIDLSFLVVTIVLFAVRSAVCL